MKKIIAVALIMLLLSLSFASFAGASPTTSTWKVYIDGTELKFAYAPIIENNVTLVPMRTIFEAMGADVVFDPMTKSITASKFPNQVQLILGQDVAFKDTIPIKLSARPKSIAGVTYVPLRFIGQSFNYTIETQGHTIFLMSPPTNTPVVDASVSSHDPTTNSTPSTPTTTPTIPSSTDLTVEQIGTYADRVVYLETVGHDGKPLASGSGIIVGSEGEILTNAHVVEDASSVKVVLSNGQSSLTTTYITYDKSRDLVLLKFYALHNLPTVKIGDSSKLNLGQSVVAIGSPLGFKNTLTSGVVSQPSRTVDGQNFIQISTPIDHGSSGGALFNMQGELVGVTSALVESSADINLAIPSNDVKNFLLRGKTAADLNALSPPPSTTQPNTNNNTVTAPSTMTASQLQSYLNQNYPTLTYQGLHLDFNWFVIINPDDGSFLIGGTMYDAQQFLDWSKYQDQNNMTWPSMIAYLTRELKNNLGIDNAYFGLYLNLYFTNQPTAFPAESYKREGSGWRLSYNFVYGKVFYDRGIFVYSLRPYDRNSNQSVPWNG
ncbi:trypsin-like peptidase domain-containing protein [Paenibacillus sp. OV219]|uniref:trypsin-like peptidase domain-containing protein n=1 Tax=Paenibacillus sp. OV219 TaxID=1884377 RepID=UPI0008BD9F52|nr:trypsin-like peptidase domain-containing protein [Paenibacillus sp. OV219]SEO80415.1 Copper amine oxidase N-terminal domain-containing protein [Paenibacillus sp. OV219]